MARDDDENIYVQKIYSHEYQAAIWVRYVELRKQYGSNRRVFFDYEMGLTLDNNRDRIKADYSDKYIFDYPALDASRRLLDTFRKDGGTATNFKPVALRMFDAYVQLKSPRFKQMLQARDDLDKMGEIVGFFLRDPKVGTLDYHLAKASEKLLHFFAYDNVDNVGSYDNTTRFLCLFAGETSDYLFALDFAFVEGDIVFLRDEHPMDKKDEKLRLYYGFCAPGEDYSPIIMRSYCLRERLAGVLYSKSALIDLNSEALDKITYEVFSTDKSFHGLATGQKKDKTDPANLLQKAVMIAKGLRIGRHLEKIEINSELHQKLSIRIKQIKVDFL